jgi:membrane protein
MATRGGASARPEGAGATPQAESAPAPQPERHEPRLRDPGLRDLSGRDWRAALRRAATEAKEDNVTDGAAALAYYAFLAIPSALLIAAGVFGLVAGPNAIQSLLDRLSSVLPADALTLIDQSLTRLTQNQGTGLALVVIGALLALWTLSGAMNALMRALNVAYDRRETRGFVRQRLTAVGMLAWILVAVLLSFGLLVLGPHLAGWVGDAAGAQRVVEVVWWAAQWPILIVGLLLAFAGVLYFGPNVDHPRWRFLTPGAALTVVIWLVASGLFALYVSAFGSYNKAWGSLAAVVIMLTWLWLSALALLLGAELNAELERSRELRRGEPAETTLRAGPKA